MHWMYQDLLVFLWVVYILYWRILAFGNKASQRLEPLASRLLRTVLFCTATLLMIYGPLPWLNRALYPQTLTLYWVGVVLTLGGMLFGLWARLTIGRNWSGTVTLKQGHELITRGPYRLVRHPIYTGLLLAIFGTDLAIAQVRAALAFLMILVALAVKWRLEERWMHEQFGQAYADYAQRTPAIVPLIG